MGASQHPCARHGGQGAIPHQLVGLLHLHDCVLNLVNILAFSKLSKHQADLEARVDAALAGEEAERAIGRTCVLLSEETGLR
jgi:hypothetical protein